MTANKQWRIYVSAAGRTYGRTHGGAEERSCWLDGLKPPWFMSSLSLRFRSCRASSVYFTHRRRHSLLGISSDLRKLLTWGCSSHGSLLWRKRDTQVVVVSAKARRSSRCWIVFHPCAVKQLKRHSVSVEFQSETRRKDRTDSFLSVTLTLTVACRWGKKSVAFAAFKLFVSC